MDIGLAHPWALALLPLVPAVIWLARRRTRPTIAWPGAAQLHHLGDRLPDRLFVIVWIAALTFGVLALAGPSRELPGDPLDDSGVAIMFVVDVSGSMAESDFTWNDESLSRLEAVKRSLKEFVARRPSDRIGVVLFGSLPDTVCPLTRDHAAVLRTLNDAKPRGVPTESETNIGDAVTWGLARLQREKGRRLLVVYSDGEHNVPAPALTPRQAGHLAKAAGVPVVTVFTGPGDGPGRSGLDALARLTEGRSFTATNANALAHANDEIDGWQRTFAVDYRRKRYAEMYPWLALAACASLLGWFVYDRGPGLTIP